jgi:hypothetical protein
MQGQKRPARRQQRWLHSYPQDRQNKLPLEWFSFDFDINLALLLVNSLTAGKMLCLASWRSLVDNSADATVAYSLR